MAVLKIIVLILRILSVTLVSLDGANCVSSMTWKRDSANDNLVFPGNIIFSIQLSSSVQCAHECYVSSVFCKYISYTSATQTCWGYRELTGQVIQPNTLFWKRKCMEPDFIYEPRVDLCLRLSVVKQGRWAASTTCNTLGGRLANLDTSAKLDIVLTGAQKDTWSLHARWWVGAYSTAGQFLWAPNQPVDPGAWYPGEPGGTSTELCVNLYSNIAQLNDLNCASEEYFVCELLD